MLLFSQYFSLNVHHVKLVSAIFYQIFVFAPNDSPSKTMKSVFRFVKKALFVLEMFKILEFFPFLSALPDTKGQMEVE